MEYYQRFCFCLLSLCLAPELLAQQAPAQSPQRDPQAQIVLQASFRAMGGSVPEDSVVIGSVVIVAGSDTQTGTIRILTRGSDQTAERISTPRESQKVTFSRDKASFQESEAITKPLSFELAQSSQSPVFPLPVLARILSSLDFAYSYLGTEQIESGTFHHIRAWNTFASRPQLRKLSGFTIKDIWIDAATSLPRKIAFEMRDGGGDSPSQTIEVSYADYRIVDGIAYPFQVSKSLNRTPWTTILIENVTFNNGLTDADFSVE